MTFAHQRVVKLLILTKEKKHTIHISLQPKTYKVLKKLSEKESLFPTTYVRSFVTKYINSQAAALELEEKIRKG